MADTKLPTVEQYTDNYLANQFLSDEDIKSLINACLAPMNDLNDTIDDLVSNRFIDQAAGVWLDVIGEIVGYPRPRGQALDENQLFAFEGTTGEGFGSATDPNVGGYWNSLQYERIRYQPVPDTLYRRLLKAAIIVREGNASIENINRFFNVVTDGATVQIYTASHDPDTPGTPSVTRRKYFEYRVSRTLSDTEAEAIEALLPASAGIGFTRRTT